MVAKNSIELTACWGNDDAESTIKLSKSKWKSIQTGAQFQKNAWSYYEGQVCVASSAGGSVETHETAFLADFSNLTKTLR